jgi:hypothetical protein
VSNSEWLHITHGTTHDAKGYTLVPWQELGFWHIGRTQVMMNAYGVEVSRAREPSCAPGG